MKQIGGRIKKVSNLNHISKQFNGEPHVKAVDSLGQRKLLKRAKPSLVEKEMHFLRALTFSPHPTKMTDPKVVQECMKRKLIIRAVASEGVNNLTIGTAIDCEQATVRDNN